MKMIVQSIQAAWQRLRRSEGSTLTNEAAAMLPTTCRQRAIRELAAELGPRHSIAEADLAHALQCHPDVDRMLAKLTIRLDDERRAKSNATEVQP